MQSWVVRHMRRLVLALLGITFLVYSPALGNGFTMDDISIAKGVDNQQLPHPLVYELQPLGEYFSSHYWRGEHDAGDLFRPLTILSYALRHALVGDSAFVAHLVNILLHLGGVLLVLRVLRQCGASSVGALLGSAVFALHAVHSEVVVGIVGRAELLAFVFGLLAVAMLHEISAWRAVVASLLLFCAYSSKESALAFLPFALLVRARLAGTTWRDMVTVLLAAGIPALVFLWLRYRMLAALTQDVDPVAYIINPLAGLDAGERIPAALVILLFGLFLCLAPFDLAADYSFDVLPLATSWSDWRVIGTALLLALLAVAAIVWWRRRPLLALAVITFFCFTFVTSNIPLPIGTIFGERLLYTASLAVSFLIAALVGVLEPAGTRLGLRRALAGLLAFWLLASSVVILLRNGVWADNRTLYLHEADNQPRSVRIVLCAAGERLYDVQRLVDEPEKAKAALRQGLAMIEQVLTIDPEYGLAHANKMAVLTVRPPFLAEFVDVAAAEAACRLAINARHAEDFPDRSQAHFNLAGICRDSGRYTEAIEHYCESLILAPKAFDTFLLLCGLVADGRWTNDAFRRYLDEARQRQPRRAEWDGYQGILEARAGGLDAARRLLESALARIVPDKFGGHCGSEFRFALADVYIRQQQGTLVEPLLQCFLKQRLRPNLFERARRLVESARRRGG